MGIIVWRVEPTLSASCCWLISPLRKRGCAECCVLAFCPLARFIPHIGNRKVGWLVERARRARNDDVGSRRRAVLTRVRRRPMASSQFSPAHGDDFKNSSLPSFYSPMGRGRIVIGHQSFTCPPCFDEPPLLCQSSCPFVRAESVVRVPSSTEPGAPNPSRD